MFSHGANDPAECSACRKAERPVINRQLCKFCQLSESHLRRLEEGQHPGGDGEVPGRDRRAYHLPGADQGAVVEKARRRFPGLIRSYDQAELQHMCAESGEANLEWAESAHQTRWPTKRSFRGDEKGISSSAINGMGLMGYNPRVTAHAVPVSTGTVLAMV